MAIRDTITKHPSIAVLGAFAVLGLVLGVTLTVTGVFAPFGLGILGLIGAGAVLFAATTIFGGVIVGLLVELVSGIVEFPKSDEGDDSQDEKLVKKKKPVVTTPTETQNSTKNDIPTPPPTETRNPTVVTTVFPPPVSSAPATKSEPIVTKEQAERVRRHIITMLSEQLPEEIGKMTKAKLIENLKPYLIVGSDHSVKVGLKGGSKFDYVNPGPFVVPNKTSCRPEKDPRQIRTTVDTINQRYGENTATIDYKSTTSTSMMIKTVKHIYTFTISPENVKKIHDSLPPLAVEEKPAFET